MFIWLFNDGLFHILYVDRPALFRLEPFTLLEAFNNEAKSGELAGAVAYNLGTWNAQGMFEINWLESSETRTNPQVNLLSCKHSIGNVFVRIR